MEGLEWGSGKLGVGTIIVERLRIHLLLVVTGESLDIGEGQQRRNRREKAL